MYNGGQDPEVYRRVGRNSQVWPDWVFIPGSLPWCKVKNLRFEEDWYAINRLGESALEKPAYVEYYKFLCPSKEGTYQCSWNKCIPA